MSSPVTPRVNVRYRLLRPPNNAVWVGTVTGMDSKWVHLSWADGGISDWPRKWFGKDFEEAASDE